MTNKIYSLIRNKKNPTTSQVTPIEFINAIEPILKDNKMSYVLSFLQR